MNPILSHVAMIVENNTLSRDKKYSDPYIYQKKYAKELRQKLVQILGESCAVCKKTENLHIDHIYGGGNKDRKEKGGSLGSYRYYIANPKIANETLQLLCKEHNVIKAKSNFEHTKVKSMLLVGRTAQCAKYYWQHRDEILEQERKTRLKKRIIQN